MRSTTIKMNDLQLCLVSYLLTGKQGKTTEHSFFSYQACLTILLAVIHIEVDLVQDAWAQPSAYCLPE